MSGGSSYLKERHAERQFYLNLGESITTQKMWDLIQIILHNPEVMGRDTFGRKRLAKIYKELKVMVNEYHAAFTSDKEADYYQEKIDAQLREIWGDEAVTFYERYPDIKKIQYDKARRGWK